MLRGVSAPTLGALPNSATKYSVAHTTSLYALDARGRTRIEFPYEAPVEAIVKGLQDVLAQRDRPTPARWLLPRGDLSGERHGRGCGRVRQPVRTCTMRRRTPSPS